MTVRMSASRVGAMIGCDPFLSRLALFLTLAGKMPPETEEQSEAITGGREFQDAVANLACRRYGLTRVMTLPEQLHHDAVPLSGHPDAYVQDATGQIAVMEVKVPFVYDGEDWGPDGSDRVPVRHFMQCLTYASLLARTKILFADYAYLAAWLPRVGLRLYKIPLNRELEKKIHTDCTQFVDDVIHDRRPDPTTEAEARLRWLAVGDKVLPVDQEFVQQSIEGERIKQQIKGLEQQLERIKFFQLTIMQEHTLAAYEGLPILSAKASRYFDQELVPGDLLARYRTKVDTALLKKEQKAAYEAAMRTPEDPAEQSRPIIALKGLKDFVEASAKMVDADGVPF